MIFLILTTAIFNPGEAQSVTVDLSTKSNCSDPEIHAASLV